MSEDKRQKDFAERLKRIHGQKNEPEQAAEPVKPARSTGGFDYNPPKESHVIRNSFIWLGFLGLVGVGGYVAWNALPRDMIVAVAGLAGVEMEGGPTTETGENPVGVVFLDETETMSIQGPIVASPNVAQSGGTSVLLSDIATGINLTDDSTQIGQMLPFARNARCDLRRPLPTETVSNIRIENALLSAPIQAFSDNQLIDRLVENVEAVTQEGQDFPADGHMIGLKDSIDVFVTDTSAPHYLVLQNMGPGVVWNVQTAPGATVAHVAIISANYSGVIVQSQDTTVEAVLVSDFVEPYRFGDDSSSRSCMVRPWRNPQPEWIGVQNAKLGDTVSDNDMFSYSEGYEAYNRWYTGALGVDAGTNLITARDAAHVLVGPAPTTPLQYQSLSGQDVRLMETDHMLTGNAASLDRLSKDLHDSLLQAAVGGDVRLLNPATLERN